MISLKSVRTLDGQTTDLHINSHLECTLDGKSELLFLPGLIDPHVALGSPDHKNWRFGVESAIRGGITTVVDIPTEDSPSASKEELETKQEKVKTQLSDLNIPLPYFPYFQGNADHFEQIGFQKKLTLALLLLFTPDRNVLDEREWDRLFQMAAWKDVPIVINSRNENAWRQERSTNASLLEKAIHYAERQNARLYVLNVGTREEIDLIQEGRSRSLLIYAETTPQHLFPQTSSRADYLWDALNSGIIETIGSGYHVEDEEQVGRGDDAKEKEEKNRERIKERIIWREGDVNFLNPMFLLPLLLTAYHEKKITLENIVRLTRVNVYDIFNLERSGEDGVLIDLEKEERIHKVSQGQSNEMRLKGWPEYVILHGSLFKLDHLDGGQKVGNSPFQNA